MEKTINFAYPHQQEPQDFLKEKGLAIPSHFTWEDFDPGLYTTLSYDSVDSQTLAHFTDQILTTIHGLNPDSYTIDVQTDYL